LLTNIIKILRDGIYTDFHIHYGPQLSREETNRKDYIERWRFNDIIINKNNAKKFEGVDKDYPKISSGNPKQVIKNTHYSNIFLALEDIVIISNPMYQTLFDVFEILFQKKDKIKMSFITGMDNKREYDDYHKGKKNIFEVMSEIKKRKINLLRLNDYVAEQSDFKYKFSFSNNMDIKFKVIQREDVIIGKDLYLSETEDRDSLSYAYEYHVNGETNKKELINFSKDLINYFVINNPFYEETYTLFNLEYVLFELEVDEKKYTIWMDGKILQIDGYKVGEKFKDMLNKDYSTEFTKIPGYAILSSFGLKEKITDKNEKIKYNYLERGDKDGSYHKKWIDYISKDGDEKIADGSKEFEYR
jgi:hypothetical protein